MDADIIEKLCKSLGKVIKFKEDNEFFGNIELVIETPRKTRFCIISDRGEISCYVIKRLPWGDKYVPIENIMKTNQKKNYNSIETAIVYLKNNLVIFEKS